MTPTTTRRWRPAAVVAAVSLVSTLLAAAAAAGATTGNPTTGPTTAPSTSTSAGAVTHETADGVRLRVKPINLTARDRVKAGSRIRFSGSVTVKNRQRRAVVLTERVDGRWRQVARKRTARGGTFKIRVKAGKKTRKRVFRAAAPAARGLRALRTKPVRVRVVAKKPAAPASPVAPASPAGSWTEADDWSYLFDGGSRWNPCSPIRWAYNPAGQRYVALADVTTAFGKIAAESGLTFQYVGTTSYRYLGDPAGFPPGIDIAVSWADDSELSDLGGDVVGVGGGYAFGATGGDVQWRIVRGYLTLDKGGDVTPAPGYDGPGWGQIMMHEILHSLGLGHAKLSSQLMYPLASASNYRFGPGDLTGMTRIGSASGCLA